MPHIGHCRRPQLLPALALVAGLAAAGLSGCGRAPDAPGSAAPPAAPAPRPPETGTPGGKAGGESLRWEEVPESQWPEAVRRFVEEKQRQGGTLAHTEGEHTYLAVLAGEQPSGGYAVEILWVTAYPDRLDVVYTLRGPGPDQVTTAVLTYPAKVIRIPRTALPAQFVEATADPESPGSG